MITLTGEEAQQVSLIEQLESVPQDARMIYEHSPFESQNIPVGVLCREAAKALRARLSAPESTAHLQFMGKMHVVCKCDKCKAQPEPELVAWKNAAIRLGEELSSVGPDGYYDMTAQQWLDWALDQQPRGKNSLPAPLQREWQGLTDEEVKTLWNEWKDAFCLDHKTWAQAIEAKLREKNT